MNTNQAFPSKYLKADVDVLPDTEVVVTIKDVSMQNFKNKDNNNENKPLMTFRELPKGLILNKTNWNTCAGLFASDESDDWIGHKIILVAVDEEAFGKPSRAIRIKNQKPAVDRTKLLDRYAKIYEKAKGLKIEGIENYTITPDTESEIILEKGKDLQKKIEAAELFA